MKLTLALATALLLAPLAALHAADTKPAKPNFVVILIDDMGYGDIGPFGSKLNRTPNLDRMASESMKLTSFYCAPLCSASRAQMMTGCYAKRVGIGDVTTADMNNAISNAINGTSNNTNGVGTLGQSANFNYNQSQMQDVLNKLDEFINAARR